VLFNLGVKQTKRRSIESVLEFINARGTIPVTWNQPTIWDDQSAGVQAAAFVDTPLISGERRQPDEVIE